jgi:hypothetical protein
MVFSPLSPEVFRLLPSSMAAAGEDAAEDGEDTIDENPRSLE